MCFEPAFSDIANGSASAVTRASPLDKRWRMALRARCAKANSVLSSRRFGVISFNLEVECSCWHSACREEMPKLSLSADYASRQSLLDQLAGNATPTRLRQWRR